MLKIDIEGGEYGIMDGLPKNSSEVFSEIAIRYYHGYSDIVEKLRGLGYWVDYTRPHFSFANMFRKFVAVGVIYAERRTRK